ncbi:MAG: SDR family oxidoreductase [Acidobacteria bacterium]|nr:SDR family oxidoreductase [Acidobacteriota bacterium]
MCRPAYRLLTGAAPKQSRAGSHLGADSIAANHVDRVFLHEGEQELYPIVVSRPNPFSLEGKTALINGASRGIGLAIAREAAAAGARAILASRSLEQLEKHAHQLRGEGLKAEAMKLDMADPAGIESAVNKAPDIDILINVAGTNIRKKFQDYTQQEYEHVLQTNLHGIVRLTQLAGTRMIERGQGGKVVNIGSLMSVRGLPFLTVYAITKSALAGLTRVLAAEWGRHNIQVNCIAPGFILTDLNRKMWEPQFMKDWLKGVQASPRTGTPEDIAPLAVFLSSRGADYITGQVIAVDGGYTTTAVWPFEA